MVSSILNHLAAHMCLLVIFGAMKIEIVSGACSFNITEACHTFDTFEDPNYEAHGMVINDICFAYMGDNALAQSVSEAYTICDARKYAAPIGTFDYGRLAVFETPSVYWQLADLLIWTGDSSQFTMLAAISDGLVGSSSSVTDYKWSMDGTSTMCPMFNSSSPTDARLRLGGTCGEYRRALCPIPDDLFAFTSLPDDGNMNVRIVCEFGCGLAPIYASTPEWWDIAGTVAAYTTPTYTTNLTQTFDCSTSSAADPSTSLKSTSSSSGSQSPSSTRRYEQTSSCLPLDSTAIASSTIDQPQDCANWCTSTTGCCSFNFIPGDATCSQNVCELFSRTTIETSTTGSQSLTTSMDLDENDSGCVHYDFVK